MKYLLSLLMCFGIAYGQSTVYIRADTIQLYKQGGNANLKLMNATKDTLGPLVGFGNGRTKFISYRALKDSIGSGGGSVTSVGTGYGLTGGPITSTGTIVADSTVLSSKSYVNNLGALKLNISDTAAMLSGYVRTQKFLDSVSTLRSKILVDSTVLATAINLKLNISDTTNKWVQAVTKNAAGDSFLVYKNGVRTAWIDRGITSETDPLSVKIADSAAMLSPYFREVGYALSKSGQTVRFDSLSSAVGFHTQPYNDLRYYPLTGNPSGFLTGNQTITLSGDISGSGTTAITTTLPTVNSNVGTWNNVTVNGKGLVTAGSNVSYQSPLSFPNTTLKYLTGYNTFGNFNDSSRASISLTTTGTSGAATYNNSTGVLNVPNYATGSGEVNTASNLGGGLANYDSKSGVDLRFNSFASADFNLATNLISIDATLKSNWNTAYGWGNHSGLYKGIADSVESIGFATQYDLKKSKDSVVALIPAAMVYPGAGIAVSTGSAWSTSITDNSNNWNTAYTDRLKWDGGATGLTASTGRTSLGGTTIGSNIFTSTNPSAVTFLRGNADNTVDWLSASDFRTAIGAGTGNGTLTTLNTLTGATQTFATGTTGTDFAISSSGTTHTFNIPDASASNRGLITTAAQTIAGNKTFTGETVINNLNITDGYYLKLGSIASEGVGINDPKLYYNSTDNEYRANVYDGAFWGWKGLVTKDGTQTLTDKTISGSSNTITNLNASNLSTGTVGTARLGTGTANSTTFLRGDNTWATPAGSGTVTSVGLSTPSWLSVSGSPVTTSGTLAVTATTGQTANRFLATPNGATGAVSLRAIVAEDLPYVTTEIDGILSSANYNTYLVPSENSTTSLSTITPVGSSQTNNYDVTALAVNTTFAAPSGTAINHNSLFIRIKDNATARTLTWNAIYRAGTDFALPTTTTISKTMYVQFIYNSADSKWDAVGLTKGF